MPSNEFAKQYTKLMRDLGVWKKAGPPRPDNVYIFQDLDSNRWFRIPIRAFSPKQAVFLLKKANPKLKYRHLDAILQPPQPPTPIPVRKEPPVEPIMTQGTLNI